MWRKSVCSTLLLAAALLYSLPGFAEIDPRRDNDPIIMSEGQTEVEYHAFEEMPRQLQRELDSKCGRQQREVLKEFPARIFRPKPKARIIALIPCGRVIMIGGRAFTVERFWQPRPIAFTVIASPSGFRATENPGFLEWRPDSLTLTSIDGTDMIDCVHPNRIRHIYSYNDGESPFTLIKVEAIFDPCTHRKELSVPVWEAPVWSEKLRQ